METAQIATLCKELLINHNRVSLGSMGAFVGQELPATLTRDAHVLLPPSRRISFRASETWNDGLLEQAYTDKGGYIKDLHELIAQYAKALAKDKALYLEGFGTLRCTKEGSVFFVMDKEVTLHPNGFGLVPLSLSPLDSPSRIKCATPVDAKKTSVNEVTPPTDQERLSSPQVSPAPANTATEENTAAEISTAAEKSTTAETTPATSFTPTTDTISTPTATKVNNRHHTGWVWLCVVVFFVVLLAAAIYLLREPLRPLLEQILYSAEERTLLS